MNIFNDYKENGLSQEGQIKINIIRGCIIFSAMDNESRKELLDFMTELEEYLKEE